MPSSKNKRKPKTSSGNGVKHRKSPQSDQQKILLGGGMLKGLPHRWTGKR